MNIQFSNTYPDHISERKMPTLVHGYTLIECLVCITILATLTSITVPSFSAIISNLRVSNTANDVLLTLANARAQAITNAKIVLVCQTKEDDAHSCSSKRLPSTNWASGWLVYIDENGDNELSQEDSIISQHSASKNTKVVFNQQGRLRFFPDGSARSAGFYVCQADSNETRHILLLYSGRARIAKTLGDKQEAVCKSQS